MRSIRIFKHYIKAPLALLALIEMGVIGLSYIAAVYIRASIAGDQVAVSQLSLVLHALLVSSVFVLAMIAMGMYEASMRGGIWGGLTRIFTAMLLGTGFLGLLAYLFQDLFFWRGIMLITVGCSLVSISIGRLIAFYYKPSVFKRRLLVLGTGDRAQRILAATHHYTNITGFVKLDETQSLVPEERIINLDRSLSNYVQTKHIDEIVVAIDDRRGKLPVRDLLNCKLMGVGIVDVLTYLERETGAVQVDLLSPSWLVFSDGFYQSSVTNVEKRVFDIVFSGVLLMIAWPIMVLAALAIYIESDFKGPILYRQKRVGAYGKIFEILKFRSMKTDAESDGKARWAVANDSRVTKVGRFIRKTRIDELPQLWNVLRGEMSIVGPRPERPEFVDTLAHNIDYYQERHRVKPGVTGWAQLSYPYGSSEKDAVRKLEYDLYYTKNHSLFFDIWILLQTAEVVFFQKGAV